MTTAVVTALYDIGRDTWTQYNVSYDGYFNWMKNLLSLDTNLVIYTEKKFYQRIYDFRKQYDSNFDKTIILTEELENLKAYKKFYSALDILMRSKPFIEKIQFSVPEMTQPLYNVIMFNKLFWIQDCIEKKFFGADNFLWLDAGGLRLNEGTYKNVIWPNMKNIPTDKITFFSHREQFTINNKQLYSLSQIRNIQGTCFNVPAKCLESFLQDVINTIEESIVLGYIGSDEKMFDISYLLSPEKYHLVKTNWREFYSYLSYQYE